MKKIALIILLILIAYTVYFMYSASQNSPIPIEKITIVGKGKPLVKKALGETISEKMEECYELSENSIDSIMSITRSDNKFVLVELPFSYWVAIPTREFCGTRFIKPILGINKNGSGLTFYNSREQDFKFGTCRGFAKNRYSINYRQFQAEGETYELEIELRRKSNYDIIIDALKSDFSRNNKVLPIQPFYNGVFMEIETLSKSEVLSPKMEKDKDVNAKSDRFNSYSILNFKHKGVLFNALLELYESRTTQGKESFDDYINEIVEDSLLSREVYSRLNETYVKPYWIFYSEVFGISAGFDVPDIQNETEMYHLLANKKMTISQMKIFNSLTEFGVFKEENFTYEKFCDSMQDTIKMQEFYANLMRLNLIYSKSYSLSDFKSYVLENTGLYPLIEKYQDPDENVYEELGMYILSRPPSYKVVENKALNESIKQLVFVGPSFVEDEIFNIILVENIITPEKFINQKIAILESQQSKYTNISKVEKSGDVRSIFSTTFNVIKNSKPYNGKIQCFEIGGDLVISEYHLSVSNKDTCDEIFKSIGYDE